MPTSGAKVVDSWEDEFKSDDDDVLESWDAEEKPKAKPATKKAPAKKAATPAAAPRQIDLDNLDEKTRRELIKKAELESDLNNAADLFGSLGVNEHPRERAAREAAAAAAAEPVITADTPISAHPLFQPETKQDFEKLRKAVGPALTKLNDKSAMYYASSLAIDLIRDLTQPLTTENIRKVISTLQVLSKEKEKAERQARLSKAGGTATGGAGKKKAKSARPNLGGAFKKDTDVVVDNFEDDFADDDFM